MSRLIKKSLTIPSGTTLTLSDGFLMVKGPKGENKVLIPQGVTAKIDGTEVWVTGDGMAKTTANQGTFWALTRNAIVGVTEGFTRILELTGVGYRVTLEGKELVLFLGYALPVRVPVPEGINIAVDPKTNTMTVTGIDKDAVGRAAAEIRALKKPEPYKGKGIHYQGEVIRRKVGKKAGAGTTA